MAGRLLDLAGVVRNRVLHVVHLRLFVRVRGGLAGEVHLLLRRRFQYGHPVLFRVLMRVEGRWPCWCIRFSRRGFDS